MSVRRLVGIIVGEGRNYTCMSCLTLPDTYRRNKKEGNIVELEIITGGGREHMFCLFEFDCNKTRVL